MCVCVYPADEIKFLRIIWIQQHTLSAGLITVIKHEPLSDQSKKLMSLIDDRQAVRSVKSLV